MNMRTRHWLVVCSVWAMLLLCVTLGMETNYEVVPFELSLLIFIGTFPVILLWCVDALVQPKFDAPLSAVFELPVSKYRRNYLLPLAAIAFILVFLPYIRALWLKPDSLLGLTNYTSMSTALGVMSKSVGIFILLWFVVSLVFLVVDRSSKDNSARVPTNEKANYRKLIGIAVILVILSMATKATFEEAMRAAKAKELAEYERLVDEILARAKSRNVPSSGNEYQLDAQSPGDTIGPQANVGEPNSLDLCRGIENEADRYNCSAAFGQKANP
jgi:hypothetical protein